MKERIQKIIQLLTLSATKFRKDDPLRLAGTTAYFTVFAMAPIIIIIVSLSGLLLGEEAIQQKVFEELNALIGIQGTDYIKKLVVIVSFTIIMLIFAMIYKLLPDVIIKWKVTWIGALITTILFVAGKYLIGLLLGNTDIGIMFGAAGSLVIILIWVFYSSLIFFFGAEITQQYAELYSKSIQPKKYAVKFEITEIEQEN
ncbi:MAG: hypothetical protein GVY19_02385 [Bacteroidetes bacterium]|jgi:membrane protein|nr:hypothetical protein [Bacteroidota bacterium]